jgi:peptide/nickel transport system ATP-binding protein
MYRIELGEEILKVHDLKVWFPLKRGIIDLLLRKKQLYVHAVDGVSFSIRRREIFCLVGESGCGKTTTGKALLRLVPIYSGKGFFKPRKETLAQLQALGVEPDKDGFVELFSLSEKKFKPIRRDIQMIYQDPYGSLNPRFRIKDILEEPLLVHKIGETKEERLDLIERVLEMVKLTPPSDFINRFPHQLSGGQRQRVAIARAIIANPSLIIADEPVSMLDVSIRAEILEVLLNLRKLLDASFIFITHDLSVARIIADRIAVMYLGKIVEIGPAEKVLHDPRHPYTAALATAAPSIRKRRRKRLEIKGEIADPRNLPQGCRFHPRCPFKTEECEKREPRLYPVEKDRMVACHHPLPNGYLKRLLEGAR